LLAVHAWGSKASAVIVIVPDAGVDKRTRYCVPLAPIEDEAERVVCSLR
jgi:hypothetical protein